VRVRRTVEQPRRRHSARVCAGREWRQGSITDERARPFELKTSCADGHPLRALEVFPAGSGSRPEPLSYHGSSLLQQRMTGSGTRETHVTTECVSDAPLDTLRGYHLAWSSAGYGRH
jgi:hypothetical protein